MSLRSAARLALAALLLAGAYAPRPAHADTDEFATFGVMREEEDDESLLDHTLTRFPQDWRDAWEGSPGAFRTSEGCLTAGEWFQIHDLKVRAATGRRSWLDLQMLTHADDRATYDWIQFQFRFGLSHLPGAWGVRFRPAFDKSQHDFSALWDLGDDSSRVQVQSVFTFEDAFNKFWEFRQTRVGNQSKPYERHPFEPALRAVWRAGDAARPPSQRPGRFDLARGARVEVAGQWLTPSRQHVEDVAGAALERTTLWGAKGSGQAEARLGRWGAEARFDDEQALSTDVVLPDSRDGRTFRRRWSAELAANARLAPRWAAEARWIYQDRTGTWRPPVADAALRALDRLSLVEVHWRPRADWRARFGFMRDRITLARNGALPEFTYGTRFETRAYLGLSHRFGNILVQGVEGIELDREPYDVSFHHDKGFLQLQTTF